MPRRKDEEPVLQWRVRRPVRMFGHDHSQSLDPESWFTQNRISILHSIIASSDDLRQMRLFGISMLSEAWTDDFKDGKANADDLDRMQTITWLQHYLSRIGYVLPQELEMVRELSERGERRAVLRFYGTLTGHIVPAEQIQQDREDLPPLPPGKVRGALFGTFAPPTFVHLMLSNLYRQYCDEYVLCIDSDELTTLRKPHLEDQYLYWTRRNILAGFPHIFDRFRAVPSTFLRKGNYDDDEISAFIKRNGINLVFLDPNEPFKERRKRQIKNGGAKVFDWDPQTSGLLHSSDIRNFRDAGKSIFLKGDRS